MELYRYPPLRILRKEDDPKFLEEMGARPLAEDFTPVLTPPSFSLRDRMTPARNQGSAGTCTSFGCMGLLEMFNKPSGGDIDLSEAELTHWGEKTYGDCSEGLAIAHAMYSLRDRGVTTEARWPYDSAQICWTHPPDVSAFPHYKFAAVEVAFQRPRAAIISDMERQVRLGIRLTDAARGPTPGNFVPILKNILANAHFPVAVGVPVWWQSDGHFSAGWEGGPDIQMPSPVHLVNFLEAQNGTGTSPPNVSGWHTLAFCGYDDSRGRFTFKNSWGRWWGDDGFGTMPYDYITQYADLAMFGSV